MELKTLAGKYRSVDQEFVDQCKDALFRRCERLNEQNMRLHEMIQKEMARVVEFRKSLPWFRFIKSDRLFNYNFILALTDYSHYTQKCEDFATSFEKNRCLYLDGSVYMEEDVIEGMKEFIAEEGKAFEDKRQYLVEYIQRQRKNHKVNKLIPWEFDS